MAGRRACAEEELVARRESFEELPQGAEAAGRSLFGRPRKTTSGRRPSRSQRYPGRRARRKTSRIVPWKKSASRKKSKT